MTAILTINSTAILPAVSASSPFLCSRLLSLPLVLIRVPSTSALSHILLHLPVYDLGRVARGHTQRKHSSDYQK